MNYKKTLPEQYIAGFVEGEGCFALSVIKDVRHELKSQAVYYRWKALFAIVLRYDDQDLLSRVKETLKCGSVTLSNSGSVRYQVSNLDELLNIIIPFFQKNELYGKKKNDFDLWSQAIEILVKYKIKRGNVNIVEGKRGFQKVEWEKEDAEKLQDLHRQMIKYKSKKTEQWADKELGREGIQNDPNPNRMKIE